MLGFRGAYRYAHAHYRAGFALECRAMRRVRDDMGLTNVKLMIPFCRTPRKGSASWRSWPSTDSGGAREVSRST
jgi:pyruvate, water dikinase